MGMLFFALESIERVNTYYWSHMTYFKTPISSKAQAIITNPPYGIKYDIIEWATTKFS